MTRYQGSSDPLRELYSDSGQPYGTSREGFDRWCEELPDEVLAQIGALPEGTFPDPRRSAPASANASAPEGGRVRPQ